MVDVPVMDSRTSSPIMVQYQISRCRHGLMTPDEDRNAEHLLYWRHSSSALLCFLPRNSSGRESFKLRCKATLNPDRFGPTAANIVPSKIQALCLLAASDFAALFYRRGNIICFEIIETSEP